jgi:short subunit dehydrogenase-like uncharacterized protein
MALVPELKGAAFECREVVHDTASLTALFTGARIVYNVTGPFSELGRPVVEAALAAGCHYLDTTGEADWRRAGVFWPASCSRPDFSHRPRRLGRDRY